jgi:hypothetical protein
MVPGRHLATFLALAAAAAIFSGCATPPAARPVTPPSGQPRGADVPPPAEPTIGSGLYGKVKLVEGNCMPPVGPSSSCRTTPVARRVTVRALSKVGGELGSTVASTVSSPDGSYQVAVPPGRYSLFVDDGGKPYCREGDGAGYACPVDVPEGKPVSRDITIDHAVW